MSFVADYNLLRGLMSELGFNAATATTKVDSLKVLALRDTVAELTRKYTYTVRDASAILETADNYTGFLRRIAIVERVIRVIAATSYSETVEMVAAIECYSGDLTRVLHELDTQYDTHLVPLAEIARLTRPMLYCAGKMYLRAPTHLGPEATARVCDTLDLYRWWDEFGWDVLASDGVVVPWARSRAGLGSLPEFQYNRGLFFGPATRTTRLVAFYFETPVRVIVDDDERRAVVDRSNRCRIQTANLVYNDDTRELTSSTHGAGHSFEIVCEEAGWDATKVRVSLVASLEEHWSGGGGVLVTTIDWVEATCLRADKMSLTERRAPLAGSMPPSPPRGSNGGSGGGNGGFARFFDSENQYRTWRVVMGNGCRVKVRVTVVHELVSGVRRSAAPFAKWTLANTDTHEAFDECALILQKYYSFQGKRYGGIHPLESASICSFVVKNMYKIGNLEWLLNARLERPSELGTSAARTANRQTSQLVQAMVLKTLADNEAVDIEYDRFETVSTM